MREKQETFVFIKYILACKASFKAQGQEQ